MRRLAAMAPAEWMHRAVQLARASAERGGLLRAPALKGEMPAMSSRPWFTLDPPLLDPGRVIAEAERLLAGRWRVFALTDAALGFPPDWNRDPKTGFQTPANRLGKSINYRDEYRVGDIKYLWEINRHLELVTLAQAWRLGADPRHQAACKTLLLDWFSAAPYPAGLNWTSSLELGIRLLNWSVAWHLLGGEASTLFAGPEGAKFRHQWLQSVHQHAHFIRGHLSRHSSANNHLLGELVGLFVAGCTWPGLPDATAYADFAQQLFEDESLRQNTADGVNREQALYYQHEVLDMMLTCFLVSRSSGRGFGNEFQQRMVAMADFLAVVGDRAGNYPMLGDADDAVIVRWVPGSQVPPYRPLIAAVAAALQTPRLRYETLDFPDKCRWLLGAQGLRWWQASGPPVTWPASRSFAEGGLHVVGSGSNRDDELKVVFDCAPLGYLSIAAHGHADALSMTLSAWGRDWLVDPGTFAYHTQSTWRDHFRGTAAHNTVCVDATNQSEIGGPFLWMGRATATLTGYHVGEASSWVEGEHDGYRVLVDPVVHRRKVSLDHRSGVLVVTDTLVCKGEHEVELCWQFAEDLAVQIFDDGVLASCDEGDLKMTCSADLVPRIMQGQETPPAGWLSRRFDCRVPAAQVRWTGRIKGGTTIVTTIALSRRPASLQDKEDKGDATLYYHHQPF